MAACASRIMHKAAVEVLHWVGCGLAVALRWDDNFFIESQRQMAQEHYAMNRWKRSFINSLEAFRIDMEEYTRRRE